MRRCKLEPGLVLRLALAGALVFAATGCKRSAPAQVIAGLHSAGAPVYLTTGDGEHPIAVGSRLRATDHVRASGPAVIEYFGGGIHFLQNAELDVGDAQEAEVRGDTIPVRRIEGDQLVKLPQSQRLVASRYADATFTPETTLSHEPTQGDYLKAFFMPDGIEQLGRGERPEGPRKTLPPPPLRARVPRLHAGSLGEGGLVLEVDAGFVAAESRSLSTAILRAGRKFELGETNRLVLFPGARAVLLRPDGKTVSLRGPMDARLE